jgi:hypothetical protein
VARVARVLGFVGRVEYRHVYSQTGGAQYGRGTVEANDLLTVYAEAFERDANPEDFSLEAILAHERGHQLLARHPRLAKRWPPPSAVPPLGSPGWQTATAPARSEGPSSPPPGWSGCR